MWATTEPEVTYLPFPVDSNDTTRGLANGRDKDGICSDPTVEDTCPSLQVIEMDVAKLGEEVD